MAIRKQFSDLLEKIVRFERRVDPYYRETFDKIFQKPLSAIVQALINARRTNDYLQIAEERLLPHERESTTAIIQLMTAFTRKYYPHGGAERAGNTKTYGIVRGEFLVLPNLPDPLREGIFKEVRSYPAWVRFAGPGPFSPPDLDDNGILSIAIKLMGVEGEKLIDDEKATQDFVGISAPTFTTPNVVENLKLQQQIALETPIFYFLNLLDSHLLDGIMQALYAKTHTSPLEVQYYSCVPYLFGEGRAIQYSIKPCSNEKSKIPKHPPNNYLRETMVRMLSSREVSFDFMVQFQIDPHRMPIENASVEWPESLSPFIPVAKLRLPIQKFDFPKQLAFAGNLSFNPWHCIAAHRPLGNQNRARKAIYLELSKLRQGLNGDTRIEPTGKEVFED